PAFAEVFQRGVRRAVDLLWRRVDSHAAQMLDILPRAARGVIRKKRAADAECFDAIQKRPREIEYASAEIKRAVEIEREVANFSQSSFHRFSHASVTKNEKPHGSDPWGFLLFSSPQCSLGTAHTNYRPPAARP